MMEEKQRKQSENASMLPLQTKSISYHALLWSSSHIPSKPESCYCYNRRSVGHFWCIVPWSHSAPVVYWKSQPYLRISGPNLARTPALSLVVLLQSEHLRQRHTTVKIDISLLDSTCGSRTAYHGVRNGHSWLMHIHLCQDATTVPSNKHGVFKKKKIIDKIR